MIIKDHKIIFIHVQKTGGTTLSRIFKYSDIGGCFEPFGMHPRLDKLLVEVPEIDLNEYEVVTVKRNPWDRFASLYLDGVKQRDLKQIPNDPIPWKRYFRGLLGLDDMLDKLQVDGVLPPNLTVFDFDNLDAEFCPWWNNRFPEKSLESLPRLNVKDEPKYVNMRKEIVSDPMYQEVIHKHCKAEIDYFGWEVPEY